MPIQSSKWDRYVEGNTSKEYVVEAQDRQGVIQITMSNTCERVEPWRIIWGDAQTAPRFKDSMKMPDIPTTVSQPPGKSKP